VFFFFFFFFFFVPLIQTRKQARRQRQHNLLPLPPLIPMNFDDGDLTDQVIHMNLFNGLKDSQ
jgi:hypothetical protein